MVLTMVLQGTFIILLPFASTLWAYLILLAFYAMTAGSMMVRIPVIVLKNVKKEEQSVAMGCVGFASGLVPLGVPSLIGKKIDKTAWFRVKMQTCAKFIFVLLCLR